MKKEKTKRWTKGEKQKKVWSRGVRGKCSAWVEEQEMEEKSRSSESTEDSIPWHTLHFCFLLVEPVHGPDRKNRSAHRRQPLGTITGWGEG